MKYVYRSNLYDMRLPEVKGILGRYWQRKSEDLSVSFRILLRLLSQAWLAKAISSSYDPLNADICIAQINSLSNGVMLKQFARHTEAHVPSFPSLVLRKADK